jgi:hypothetical protein
LQFNINKPTEAMRLSIAEEEKHRQQQQRPIIIEDEDVDVILFRFCAI